MRIHQTLHGYDRGHRLLASSIPLPPAASRCLLELSDANDVIEDADFPSLIAGFPLPETGFYALLKTWPAPEVDRVGSVWTHTLLFESDDLDSLSPRSALRAFKRPSARKDVAAYSVPISVSRPSAQKPINAPEIFPTLLWALYEEPLAPVIVVLDHIPSSQRQLLLLCLISQQWSAITERFAFAEAPRWARRLDGRAFDLQLTARSAISDLAQRNDRARVITKLGKFDPPLWAQRAAAELGDSAGLRAFLHTWGPADADARAKFPALTEIWAAVNPANSSPGSSAPALLRSLDHAFPRRGEMADLKKSLFGAPEDRRFFDLPDAELLTLLATEPAARCLSIPDMRLEPRLAALWRGNPETGGALLGAIDLDRPSDIARAILSASAAEIPAAELGYLLADRPELWSNLLLADPSLAARTDLSGLSAERAHSLLLALRESAENPVLLDRAVAALAREAPGVWSGPLHSVFAETVCAHPERFIDGDADIPFWAPVISRPALAEWARSTSLTSEQVLLLADSFDAASVQMVSTDLWLAALAALTDPRSPASSQALLTLLAAALTVQRPPADQLAVLAFDRLWVPPEAWSKDLRSQLRGLTPTKASGEPKRDLCTILASAFRSHHAWCPEAVLLVERPKAFAALLERDSALGSRSASLAYRLAERLPLDNMSAEQYRLLQANLAKHAKRDDILGILESVVRRVTGLQ